jgi:arylsulfatase A-like enzyme
MRMYDPEALKLPPNWKAADKAPGRKQIAAYYAAITAIDDQVGRLMATLDELGMAEDTIVLFSSDHGDMLGSQGARLKRKPWEESIRVPGIFRYPRRIKAGRSETALFSHIDFAPTLLALCGVSAPKQMQGADLSSLVTGQARKGPDSAFFQIFGPYMGDATPEGWRGVRTNRFTYARFRSKPWVLYDLQADPSELNNLVDDPAARSLLAEMDNKVEAWMKRTGDSWDYDWTERLEDGGRLHGDRTFYTVQECLASGPR